MSNRIVEVSDCKLLKSTDSAGFYEITDSDGLESQHWIPFSQLADGSIDKDGDEGSIFIPLWIAEDRELEYEYLD